MDYEFCQGREAKGPIVVSPHGSHLDTFSNFAGLRNLRHSLARSPSKLGLRNYSRSPSMSPSSHSPLKTGSPSRMSADIIHLVTDTVGSETPCPPSAKKFRPALRRNTPLRIHTCPSATPRVSVRRALSDTSDHGNASPSSRNRPKAQHNGQENSSSNVISGETLSRNTFDANQLPLAVPDKNGGLFGLDNQATSGANNLTERRNKSSPVKRSDVVISLEQSNRHSPSMKRKSVSGGFASSPFDIACDKPIFADEPDFSNGVESDDEDALGGDAVFRSPLAPKNIALRKSTLFRSLDRPAMFRGRRSVDGVIDGSKSPKAQAKGRPRFSLDSALPTNETPHEFTSSSSMMDTDRPFEEALGSPQMRSQLPKQPIDIQGLTNSRQLDYKAFPHDPKFAVLSLPVTNFSKSLPIGALRPTHTETARSILPQGQIITTPQVYKIARPDPAAFRSTGLISKKHRDPDNLPPPPPNGGLLGMPDTPCKRAPMGVTVAFSPSPIHTAVKSKFAQPQFGTPSKPFSPHGIKPTPLTIDKSTSVFGSLYPRGHGTRRESFTSFDGEDSIQSPTAPADSQSSTDELPPTPTKQASASLQPKQNSLRSSLLGRRPSIGGNTFAPPDRTEPGPLHIQPLFLQPPKPWVTTRTGPQTPADGAFPDPSGLTITPRSSNPLSPTLYPSFGSSIRQPPETPTHRETHPVLANPLMTPSNHGLSAQDVDHVLTTRFKRVERYGKGEFSEVYKVYNPADSPSSRSYFSPGMGSKSSQVSRPDKVWIVKKSIKPYLSSKARERRLEEVRVMRCLGKSEHIVQLVDSWEVGYHLYIQTEYCEEGDLETFLAQAGRKDRLEDFRCWKILVELCQGIKHIHDTGFIHLDLKPANVFIDFEGVLKIGDFGMAVRWPAPIYAESEGDRRYIGPDLLQGRLDKPADIFALGVMMVEIAGNIFPPDNGTSWQKLRSGDWSDMPSLTGSSSGDMLRDLQRDVLEPFNPTRNSKPGNSLYLPDDINSNHADTIMTSQPMILEDGVQPPQFMLDKEDDEAMDKLVQWMMAPEPENRPVVNQILAAGGVLWVNARRRAGAIVFEGRYGPSDHVLHNDDVSDQEMADA